MIAIKYLGYAPNPIMLSHVLIGTHATNLTSFTRFSHITEQGKNVFSTSEGWPSAPTYSVYRPV